MRSGHGLSSSDILVVSTRKESNKPAHGEVEDDCGGELSLRSGRERLVTLLFRAIDHLVAG